MEPLLQIADLYKKLEFRVGMGPERYEIVCHPKFYRALVRDMRKQRYSNTRWGRVRICGLPVRKSRNLPRDAAALITPIYMPPSVLGD